MPRSASPIGRPDCHGRLVHALITARPFVPARRRCRGYCRAWFVAVLAAGQITTFHTISVMLCEIVLGTSVSAQTRHDRRQMVAADEDRVAGPAAVGGAGQNGRASAAPRGAAGVPPQP